MTIYYSQLSHFISTPSAEFLSNILVSRQGVNLVDWIKPVKIKLKMTSIRVARDYIVQSETGILMTSVRDCHTKKRKERKEKRKYFPPYFSGFCKLTIRLQIFLKDKLRSEYFGSQMLMYLRHFFTHYISQHFPNINIFDSPDESKSLKTFLPPKTTSRDHSRNV